MTLLKIRHENKNLEIVAKIVNSVASKYDCAVRYDSESNAINFSGSKNQIQDIVAETLWMLGAD